MAKFQVTSIGLCLVLFLLSFVHSLGIDEGADEYDDYVDNLSNNGITALRQELLDIGMISRGQNVDYKRLKKQLSRLVGAHLIDLLKYHRFDQPLSKGHKSEIEKLHGGFIQMKRRMHLFNQRLRESEDQKILLQKEMTKNMLYTRRLEQQFTFLQTRVNQFEEDLEKKISLTCSCNQSLSGLIREPVTSQPIPVTSSATPVFQPQPVVLRVQNIVTERTNIIAVSHENPQFVQITLKDKKMKGLALKSGFVKSIVYDPITNKTVWSKSGPGVAAKGIYSSNIQSAGEINKLSEMTASAMAVDASKNWIIFTTGQPQKTISRIRNTGGDYTEIIKMTKYSDQQDIAVDPEKELIFTCDGDYIIETDYQGKDQRVLILGGFIVSLALDVDQDLLYYFEYDMIKTLRPKSGETSVVKDSLGVIPKDMTYYKNKLYFGGYFESFVKVLDTKSLVVTDLGNLKGNSISMCLVI